MLALAFGMLVVGIGALRANGPTGDSTTEVLRSLRRVAIATPDEHQGVTRYLVADESNLVTLADAKPAFSIVAHRRREQWTQSDGSGRLYLSAASVSFFNDQDEAHWTAMGSPGREPASSQSFGIGGLSYEDFAAFPRTARELERTLRDRARAKEAPVEVAMFRDIAELLRDGAAPSELRSALFDVLANLPSVQHVEAVTRFAQATEAVGVVDRSSGSAERLVMMFDTRTASLAGEEEVVLERAPWLHAKPPILIRSVSYHR